MRFTRVYTSHFRQRCDDCGEMIASRYDAAPEETACQIIGDRITVRHVRCVPQYARGEINRARLKR